MNDPKVEFAKQSGFRFYALRDIDGQDLGTSIEADDWAAIFKFAALLGKECTERIESEIDRLGEYRKELGDSEEHKREDVDLCVKKCYDIIDMLENLYGTE